MARKNRQNRTRRPQRIKGIPVRVERMLVQVADDITAAVVYMGNGER